ncbi:MAG: hypothetical protein HY535_05965 [Chloroflexi bacterium]|nr:hypothetical protein [Chloroflexota bacterium]
MSERDKRHQEPASLMAAVAAIVEAFLEGQPLHLPAQRLSRWKEALWQARAQDQARRTLGWSRR